MGLRERMADLTKGAGSSAPRPPTGRCSTALPDRLLDRIGRAVERLSVDEETFLDFPSCTGGIP